MSEDLPRGLGPPVLRARIRCVPEDFRVEELSAFEASGSGEHLLLSVEKRGMNTAFAARRIAAWAGVADGAVSWAGMKDRHAITRQRFSVHLPGRETPDVASLESDDLQVLSMQRHARKLQRGALAGNRFALVLREVDGDIEAIGQRLRAIAVRGVPNYFGEQRFGRERGNVASARRMFAGRRVRREERALLLSAARSALFNEVLAERVRRDCWDRALAGEVFMLGGSRSVFGPEPLSAELEQRLQRFDVHPTGPLWGRGWPATTEVAGELEREVAAAHDDLCRGLAEAGLRQERRALRLRPRDLGWNWIAPGVLCVSFELEAGAYATTLLHALGDCVAPADVAWPLGRGDPAAAATIGHTGASLGE